MDTYLYVIAVIGGFLAGIINTLAGNGSAITLTIMIEMMGLPPNVANGTNRIGNISQASTSIGVFYKNGKLDIKENWLLIVSVFIGAMFGLWLALTIDNDSFKQVFKYLMVILLVVILLKPKRWLKDPELAAIKNPWLIVPVFLCIGFYGGFIQMGMGVIFLAASVLLARYPLAESNALKIFSIASYNIIVLAVFAWSGLIAWQVGLALAAGQSLGGWVTANFASNHPKANIVTYWMLVVIIVLALVKLFLV